MASGDSRTAVVAAPTAASPIAVLESTAAAISGSTVMPAGRFHPVAEPGNEPCLMRGTDAGRDAASVRHPLEPVG